MTARVRIEWVEIGRGSVNDAAPASSVRKFVSAVAEFSVTGTATAGSSRPSVPALLGDGYGICARITCLDNPVFVSWGADPTASSTAGIRIEQGQTEVVAVNAGDLLSFITAPVGDPIPTTATVNGSDIELGAVEFKDGASDNRASVDTHGSLSSVPRNAAGDALAVSLDGTDITAAVMPAGGVGIRGWLSNISTILTAWATLLGALADAAWTVFTNAPLSIISIIKGIVAELESIRALMAGYLSTKGYGFDVLDALTTTSGAYSAGDVVGGYREVEVARANDEAVCITGVQVVFKAAVQPNIRVIIFGVSTVLANRVADNGAYALDTTDCLGVRKSLDSTKLGATYTTHGTPKSISLTAQPFVMVPITSTKKIGYYLIDDSGVTLTSTADVQVRFSGAGV